MASAIDGHLGPEGLREIVYHPMRYGLAELLELCLPSSAPLDGVALLRTKFKPARKLSAYYRITVGHQPRAIALTWLPEPSPLPANAAEIDDDAERRQVLAPFRRLAVVTGDGRATLLVAPGDPQMPQLVRLNEHAYLGDLLSDLTSAPMPPADRTEIATVRYRPGQRHVLWVMPVSDGAGGAAMFIKIDRESSGARAVSFAESVGPILARRGAGVRLAQPLGFSQADQASVWQQAPGRTLAQALRAGPQETAPLVTRVGRALRVIHESDLPTASIGAQEHDRASAPRSAEVETISVLRAGEHLDALLPEVAADYRRLVAQILDRLEALPQEQPSPGHGDLKCENIVVEGDRICLLDLDRAGLADPALDLGKFMADLRWWSRSSSLDGTALVPALVEGYGPGPPARWLRAHQLALLFQLKLAARRSPVHASDWATQVTKQVADVAISLRHRPGVMIASTQLGAASTTAWLAERDPALSHLPEALRLAAAPGWTRHDVQWTPGQRCRLAYHVARASAPSTFVALDLDPTGWSQLDYRSDSELPGLAVASDAKSVTDLLEPVVGEPIHGCRVQPVRYRPGSRCVLQYDVVTAAGAVRYYAKVFASEVFLEAAKMGTRVAAAVHGIGHVPRMVAVWPEIATIVAEAAEGRSVSAVLSDPDVPVSDRVAISARLGGFLAHFHALAGISAPIRTAAGQVRALQDLIAPVHAVDGQLGDRFTGAIDTLRRRLPASDGPGVLTHGSFRPGQVIVSQANGLTLLDLDNLCRGDAARDLATALAHMSWQATKHPTQRDTWLRAETSLVSGYVRAGGSVARASLRWWRAAASLQVAARRFRRLEVSDWGLIPAFLELAEGLLSSSPGELRC